MAEYGEGETTKEPGVEESLPHQTRAVLVHKQLLAQRLYIHAWVRMLAVAWLILGAPFARYVIGVTDLNVMGLASLGVLLGIHNTGIFAVVYHYRRRGDEARIYPFLARLLHATIVTDFLFLTVALWFVGGAKSPFQVFYIVHIMIAAVLLTPRAACVHALVGFSLFSCLVVAQWLNWIPLLSPLGAVNDDLPLDGRYVLAVLTAQGMLMVASLFLLSGLVELLRRGEERLCESNIELARLSQMRRNFLHIALHDLKAPIAAAQMLLYSLDAGPDPPLDPRRRKVVERVQARFAELTAFLRDLQTLSSIETGDFEEYEDPVNVADLLGDIARENEDLAGFHGHRLVLEIPEPVPPVRAVPFLLHEAVANLLSNALKYTPEGGTITLRARNVDNHVHIEVQDTGIGIDPKDRERLFQDFSRLRRIDGGVRAAPGSGLGLSIVRRIVEAQGGTVDFRSRVNEGSTFFITLPAADEAGEPPEVTRFRGNA